MNFEVLTAIFTVYSNNFKALHWAASGEKFDRIHATSGEYYDMISDDLDTIAELGLRNNHNPAIISNCIQILGDYEHRDFVVIQKFDNVDYKTFCTMSDKMLTDICSSIEDILDTEEIKLSKNVGIKSVLEGLHDKYDLQARYINSRRSV